MQIATYVRVSTKAQGEDDAYGLPRQRAELDAYLAAHPDLVVVASFEDIGYSGAKLDRPGIAQMLDAEGFDAVLVPSWDRLARDGELDGFLRYSFTRRSIQVLSATQDNGVSPASKMMQGMLALVAGYERSLITARLAGSRRAKAAAGGYASGTPPFGTKCTRGSGVLTVDESELTTLRRIQDLRCAGLALRKIAAQLDAEGLKPRSGGRWSHNSVQGALKTAPRVDALLG
jgi:site-specific DNA recombinase